MHVQMGISSETEAKLERLLKELRLAHLAEEIELKKLLHRCTASGKQKDVDAYDAAQRGHRSQAARLTLTNVLRVALEVGLSGAGSNDARKLLSVLGRVGVARGYGRG